ncbi:metalloendopeptidase [Pseudoalteromonas sp. MSK9-3]|uniref:M23 family metallopeptidase n=1 Tax=Pseudoalteromonas sp. MSK9-3 TaxID=1897633 RepID=UPI000E6B6E8D|nr:M23 family metallopeptidase [Pseudoalteromonas sp. MSK9-3]RJE78299.1 metalloendopeptidase [Pseudoalteromonas sp. MSK9-3]
MKKLFVSLFFIPLSLTACSKPVVDCTVFPALESSAYLLPYEVGTTRSVYAATEHYRASNNGVGTFAIDFVMPIGTKVLASRAGEVVSVREVFEDGNNIDLEENYIFIQHDDGSVARYFHLTKNGSFVSEGDNVKAGDIIGLSGNTGQSGGPHLHFDVQKCGPNLPPNYNALPCGQTIPITFKNTQSHTCGLKSGTEYKALIHDKKKA